MQICWLWTTRKKSLLCTVMSGTPGERRVNHFYCGPAGNFSRRCAKVLVFEMLKQQIERILRIGYCKRSGSVCALQLIDGWSPRHTSLFFQNVREVHVVNFNQLLKRSPLHKTSIYDRRTGSVWVPAKHKSSGGRRPKKKIYQRVHELDRVMDLQKKPSLILQLKSIIQSQKHRSLLLRDLEKQVGFVQKWSFMAVIEKYPSIFCVDGGNRTPSSVRLTDKAQKIGSEEAEASKLMEPILVKNLRKLLMLSVDCRVPLEKIEFIESELGLPNNFRESLILKYPEFFTVKDVNGKAYLHLENWDSSLAVTAREERLACEGFMHSSGGRGKVKISKDGNYQGPYAFRMDFPAGFRPNMSYLEELEKWQKMEFPSPYLNARRFEAKDPKARKRVVAVLHELLSLTMEKRMTSAQLDAFHLEYLLPSRLLLCLIKRHGMFYITNRGVKSTVFLKEAYGGSNLIDKCPLLLFYDKFVSLSGRREMNLHGGMPSSQVVN